MTDSGEREDGSLEFNLFPPEGEEGAHSTSHPELVPEVRTGVRQRQGVIPNDSGTPQPIPARGSGITPGPWHTAPTPAFGLTQHDLPTIRAGAGGDRAYAELLQSPALRAAPTPAVVAPFDPGPPPSTRPIRMQEEPQVTAAAFFKDDQRAAEQPPQIDRHDDATEPDARPLAPECPAPTPSDPPDSPQPLLVFPSHPTPPPLPNIQPPGWNWKQFGVSALIVILPNALVIAALWLVDHLR